MNYTRMTLKACIMVIIMTLGILIPTATFAKTVTVEVKEERVSATGKINITNVKTEIPDLKTESTDSIGLTLKVADYDSQGSKLDVYYSNTYISKAVVVTRPSKIVVELEKPTYGCLAVYKLEKRGKWYFSDYRSRLPISSGKIITEKNGDTIYYNGVTINLPEAGEYLAYIELFDGDGGQYSKIIYIKVEGKNNTDPFNAFSTRAVPKDSTLSINNKANTFETYFINDTNHFKLRDIAFALSQTDKQFDIQWDKGKNGVNLISNSPYTPSGGEMVAGDGKEKVPVLGTSKIYKDGKEIALSSYVVNGQSYVRFLDIAKILDIGMTWNDSTNTVEVDTTVAYNENALSKAAINQQTSDLQSNENYISISGINFPKMKKFSNDALYLNSRWGEDTLSEQPSMDAVKALGKYIHELQLEKNDSAVADIYTNSDSNAWTYANGNEVVGEVKLRKYNDSYRLHIRSSMKPEKYSLGKGEVNVFALKASLKAFCSVISSTPETLYAAIVDSYAGDEIFGINEKTYTDIGDFKVIAVIYDGMYVIYDIKKR